MHSTNSILFALDIDSSEFFYKNKIHLYDDKDHKNPYGKVTFENGHYKLTIGDLSLLESIKDYERSS